jgi:hypothetical protein
VQEARIDRLEAIELGLDAHLELGVAAEPEMPGHGRACAVGAENVARREIKPGKAKVVAVARGAREPGSEPDAGAGALRLAREPAQQPGRVGGEKEAAGREQIDVA